MQRILRILNTVNFLLFIIVLFDYSSKTPTLLEIPPKLCASFICRNQFKIHRY